MKLPWKVIFCGIISNVLEAYDFLLYGMFSHIIAQLFFPDSKYALIMTLTVFATGFVFRPFGALVLGSIGDYFGRKRALLISAFLMSIPTVLIGCLPTFDQIGLFAPILLIICRLLQGFSVGGEYNGASIFVIEHTSPAYSGFVGSFIATSSTIGSLLALGAALLFTNSLMPEWSWRIPFFLGIFMGILGIYIRMMILESPEFKKYVDSKEHVKASFKSMITQYYKQIICVIGIGGLNGVLGYTFFTYLNVYFKTVINMPFENSLMFVSVGLATLLIATPLSGFLSDKIGHGKQMAFGSLSLCLYSYPFYEALQSSHDYVVIGGIMIAGCLSACFIGPSNAFMNQLFPVYTRYRGVALGFGAGMAIFGGTTPVFNTLLIQQTENLGAPAIYVFICSLFGFLSSIYAMGILRQKESTPFSDRAVPVGQGV